MCNSRVPFSGGQVDSRAEMLVTVSAGLIANLIISNKHVLCELILGGTVSALTERQLNFLLAIGPGHNEFYMNFHWN